MIPTGEDSKFKFQKIQSVLIGGVQNLRINLHGLPLKMKNILIVSIFLRIFSVLLKSSNKKNVVCT